MSEPTSGIGPATTREDLHAVLEEAFNRRDLDGPSTDVSEVKQAVDRALPIVRAHASAAERDGRIADEVVEVLRLTGINRLLLPAEMGGIEAGVDDIMDIVGRIAMVDGSTAWCAVIGTGSNLFSGYLPPSGASRVFADPDQGNATMFAPAGTLTAQDGGGYRLSGRWPFTSNCLHSEWIGLGALEAGGSGPGQVLRVAFVHASDVTILETWESGGLQGTGSHDVLVRDVAVGADRCCVFNGRPWADSRLWRMPVVSVLFPLLAAVPLGIARGAIEEVARQARDGRSARRGQVGDDPIALMELGTAAIRLGGAAAGLREAVLEADALAGWQEPIGPDLQAKVCLAAQVASDAAVEATSTAHQVGGGAAAYRSSPLLRALEDVEAARQHQLFAHKHRGELTKALVGLDVRYPPFVV